MVAVSITEANIEQIRPLLSKLSRCALKLKKSGKLTKKVLDFVNKFCETVKKRINKVEKNRAEKLKKQYINIEIKN